MLDYNRPIQRKQSQSNYTVYYTAIIQLNKVAKRFRKSKEQNIPNCVLEYKSSSNVQNQNVSH